MLLGSCRGKFAERVQTEMKQWNVISNKMVWRKKEFNLPTFPFPVYPFPFGSLEFKIMGHAAAIEDVRRKLREFPFVEWDWKNDYIQKLISILAFGENFS